ncbi:aldose epimerase family protein [Pareuzebyella sediminis]|uniref:aldose epimerase family protein n=1 Tax=Pareuzebyella sediminis TaxID=2607998 RepID=UPI0011EC543B|nr:aldose epimerase family protein [Pareuzebyella sediminis]
MKQVTLQNENIILVVLDYGAVIQKLLLKDKNGRYTNVVVGLEFPSKYIEDKTSLGACVGRYAGRISKGFVLDRETYPLYTINGVHLHGGKEGFAKKQWTIDKIGREDEPFVQLSYLSNHLEEGYPGNLKASVTYKLVDNALHIIHEAISDRTTVVNLTNHSYFRLDSEDTVSDYRLQLNCSHYAETLENLVPTGNLLPTKGTPYDFLSERPIGQQHLDTPFITDLKAKTAAKVSSLKSGISIEVITNQPAVVVYTPVKIPAICFETQNLPDAPNHNNFPNCILRPGEKYRNVSEFRFVQN